LQIMSEMTTFQAPPRSPYENLKSHEMMANELLNATPNILIHAIWNNQAEQVEQILSMGCDPNKCLDNEEDISKYDFSQPATLGYSRGYMCICPLDVAVKNLYNRCMHDLDSDEFAQSKRIVSLLLQYKVDPDQKTCGTELRLKNMPDSAPQFIITCAKELAQFLHDNPVPKYKAPQQRPCSIASLSSQEKRQSHLCMLCLTFAQKQ